MLLGRLSNERFHDGLVVGTHGTGFGLDRKDANFSIVRIGASPFLDIRELSCSGAARKTKLRAHTLAGRREGFPTAGNKFRDRHLLSSAKMVENNGGR